LNEKPGAVVFVYRREEKKSKKKNNTRRVIARLPWGALLGAESSKDLV
jgi:hypothetical protein